MKTIYVDTSVYGGRFDSEFSFWTEFFFDRIVKSDIQMIYSEVVDDELFGAPQKVKEFIESIPEKNILKVELTEEAILLAEKYLKENVVGNKSRADCYHIATATILKADVLVSWNFKHTVNIGKIKGYNAVNMLNDYWTLEIRSPREIFDYDN